MSTSMETEPTPSTQAVRDAAKKYTSTRRKSGAQSDAAIAALLALETARSRKRRSPIKSTYLGRLRSIQSLRQQLFAEKRKLPIKNVWGGMRIGPYSERIPPSVARKINRLEQQLKGARMALVVASTKRPARRTRVVVQASPVDTETKTNIGAPNAQGVTVANAAGIAGLTPAHPIEALTRGVDDISTTAATPARERVRSRSRERRQPYWVEQTPGGSRFQHHYTGVSQYN